MDSSALLNEFTLVFSVTLLRSINHKVNSFLTADIFILHKPHVRYGLKNLNTYEIVMIKQPSMIKYTAHGLIIFGLNALYTFS